MAENFYTLLTKTGKAKFANAQALGMTVNITHMGVGDSNGSYYNPTENQDTLVNEVWRGLINSINVDSTNPNWIVIEAVIPTTDGGFMAREVGVFDEAGDMIAVGKYPETYKPITTEGSAKDLYIRMILEISNSASVTLKIDPAIVLATKKNVEDAEKSAKSFASGLIGSLADLLTTAKNNIVAAINEIKTNHDEHLADTATAHGATTAATPDKIVLRDGAGRLLGSNNGPVLNGVWATTESKSAITANGATLVSDSIIPGNCLFLAFVFGSSTAFGVYSIGLLGVTAFINTITTFPNVTVTLDGTNHVVITNNTGELIHIKLNLIEVI